MTNESRLKFIKELESFIIKKQNTLNSVLNTLEWTEKSMNDDMKVCCPVNPAHWIAESALPHHKEICELVKNGYQKEELEKQPPDSTFFYEKTPNVIPVVLDQASLQKILSESSVNVGHTSKDVPKTIDRWSVQFTPDQRLAVYDFVINTSKTIEKPQNVTLEDLMMDFEKKDDQDDKPKSQLEILAEMRDYKRRRQSYRAKNVHITKKSYTEVMREVIENQTNYLMHSRKFENLEEKNHEDSVDSKRKYTHDSDDSSEDASPKYNDHHSRHRREDYDSKYHHSRHKSSKHSPKRKKHKKDRSRSPSRHKHKKSHKRKSHHD